MESAIASSELLGLALTLVLLTVGYRNRPYVRELTTDPGRGWRRMPAIAAGALTLFITWTSIFDNWRQLTGIPFRAIKQYPSQRVELDPPSAAVRGVTFALLAIALVLVATLAARHVGGYLLQLAIAMGAVVAWLPFFVIRQRFTLNLAMGFSGSWKSPADIADYIGFVAITYLFDIGLIVVCFAALLGVVAIPVTLLLDITRTRRPRITAEAKPFFTSIGDRAATARHG